MRCKGIMGWLFGHRWLVAKNMTLGTEYCPRCKRYRK